ncbi:MAG: CPBP family intramembrane metalloprotease [Candidatus Peribacteraceae bacterium]|nr:CPBP family intramembrane metalloprotease [Candidatus Peribacteraceae bacterium]MDD5743041.1 CPBP family intramembrane metalloprotease [Candidatus Peribacteraceae bacterium]
MSHSSPLRRVRTFVLALYVVSYLFVLLYFVFGGQWQMPGALIVAVTYMFLPLLVSLVLIRFVHPEPVRPALRLSFRFNRWWIVAWAVPPVLALLTFVISLLLPGVSFDATMTGMFARFGASLTPEQLVAMQADLANAPFLPLLLGLVGGLVAGITVNAVAAFGEEAGWRGYLLRLLLPLGFWKSSLIIGTVWGLWHAPLILLGHNYPQHPVAGVAMMTLWTILLTPLMNYITLRAKSVLAAAVFHGTLNGTLGLALLYVRGGSDLTVGGTGLAGMLALVLVNVMLYWGMKKHRLSVA